MTKNQLTPPASHFHDQGEPLAGGKSDTDTFTVYVDGSSLHNPGPAGWAVLIIHPGGSRTTLAGSEAQATNNQMELRAAIEALQALPRDASGVLYCDSEYVVNGVTVWRRGWETRGWRNSKGQPVANAEIWRALHALSDERPGLRFQWVRGHAGNSGNELVDTLARAEAEKVRAGLPPTSQVPIAVSKCARSLFSAARAS
jgi:ribonuclease HI